MYVSGYGSGYGQATDSGSSWYSDPKLWAAVLGAASTYANAPKAGNINFKQVPETPEEKAYRLYAENLAGMHGTANPTLAYLGPQINNQLATIQANSGAYRGLDKIDPATGQMIARPTVATPSPLDFSKLPQPWANPGASIGSAATVTNNPNDPHNAPPPPPEVNTSGFDKTRKKNVLKKALGGLVTGAIGGFVGGSFNPYAAAGGALVGEYKGGQAANKEAQAKWDAAYADFNQWKALYGDKFTDAQGHPVKAPQNQKEYNAWYIAKYGVPPPTGAA